MGAGQRRPAVLGPAHVARRSFRPRTCAELELERLAAVQGRVELAAILVQRASVVHGQAVAALALALAGVGLVLDADAEARILRKREEGMCSEYASAACEDFA